MAQVVDVVALMETLVLLPVKLAWWLLGGALTALAWSLRKLLRWLLRATVELAAYLGFHGRRLVLLMALVVLVVMAGRMFGHTAALKLGAVFLMFAFTSRQRRQVRGIKLVRQLDRHVTELGRNVQQLATAQVTATAQQTREQVGAAVAGGARAHRLRRAGLPADTPQEVLDQIGWGR